MITYINGEFLPEDEAKISVFDHGFMLGDGVYEIERTFGGAPFRLDDHLDRLRRSLRYVELDGDALVAPVREATLEVIARNKDEIRDAGDVWVHQIVTGGSGDLDLGAKAQPSIVVTLRPLQFDTFGPLYDGGGIDLEVSLLTRHFAGAMDHRVKATSRGAWTRAEHKTTRANQQDPTPGQSTMTVIFNDDGSIAEAVVANLCIVEGDRLVRPPRYDALEGVSLKTLCEIAETLGMGVEERKLGLYDFINADASFVTATSFSLLPALSIDGIALDVDRDLYTKLLRGWIDLAGFDFVGQAQDRAQAKAPRLASG